MMSLQIRFLFTFKTRVMRFERVRKVCVQSLRGLRCLWLDTLYAQEGKGGGWNFRGRGRIAQVAALTREASLRFELLS